ncbi:MAG: YicC family protein [Flavobacteriales bacterium]|nr:YicC family protein [Flavobacteriales bacterium]
MIYSMTGFGKASREINNKKFTVEVRSLNSKSLDLNLKFPPVFREHESEIRSLIAQILDRGKIDFWILQEDLSENTGYAINEPLVISYYKQLKELSASLQIPETDWMQLIFRLPEVVKTSEETLSDETWNDIKSLITEALNRCMEFRRAEGISLMKALENHVAMIEKFLEETTPFEISRTEKLREKLRKSMLEVVKESETDQNRFEQEIVYYLEKLDISEEKVRLKSHCNYFRETMQADGFNGRKLNFIGQEMGREINTLGSKASDAQIQRIVVQMKDELEKIKEQVLNVL